MKTTRRTREQSVQLAIAALAASLCTGVTAQQFSDWAPAQPVAALNTTFNEGCPMESPDTLSLYFASTRPGMGGNDIWVARRADESSPWGSPENLGPPVNSPANEMCPTPLRGNGLLFVSDRPGSDACMAGPGRPDMYFARRNPAHGWVEAETLGCGSTDDGPNSVAAELTPSLAETPSGGRIINIHLGLSPYYRGAGTNFWPLVNREPEYVGATIHYLDAGIDTGPILAHARPRIDHGDGPHDIGNKTIVAAADALLEAATAHVAGQARAVPQTGGGRLYQRKDFNADAVRTLYRNFDTGMIDEYLAARVSRDAALCLIAPERVS
jgi:hypothetical protein